jgi:cyclic-di-GMP phosphodiesterase TipF (flagellum assembly factor)
LQAFIPFDYTVAQADNRTIRIGRPMRKLTLILLGGASLCLALTIAFLVAKVSGVWAAGAAGFAAAIGLGFSLYGVVGRSLDQGALRKDFATLRDAHLMVTEQLEQIHESLAILAEAVQEKAVRSSEELTLEVRVLEDLIHRMSLSLDEKLTGLPDTIERPQHTRHPHQALGRTDEPAPRQDARQNAALLTTVREALAENRVDLYLQPIVSLPQRRTVFYESFSRLRDATGRVLMPAEYLSVAEPEGLVAAIDNLLLFRCVQIVRRLARQDRKVAIFCNIALSSLADEAFFPQFLEFLGENKDLASALVFELGFDAFEARGSVESRNMTRLADLGFRFSLDKVADVDLDFRELLRADIKFVKIGADVLLEQLVDSDSLAIRGPLKDVAANDYAAFARRYGVEIIAEKVETERQVIDVLDFDIGYGQGNLFGEPRAIRDAILAEAEPPAAFLRSAQKLAAGR